ncbi:MAG: hypothetical protein RL367_2180, partial [Pseudomonadota bacterium]
EVRRLRDCSARPGKFTELDVAIPSITTDHGNNPSLKLFSFDAGYEWTENLTFYDADPAGKSWASTGPNNPLSFDQVNYPCPSCKTSDSLMARIKPIDTSTLARDMIAWLKVGAPPPGSAKFYQLALDVTCDSK